MHLLEIVYCKCVFKVQAVTVEGTGLQACKSDNSIQGNEDVDTLSGDILDLSCKFVGPKHPGQL